MRYRIKITTYANGRKAYLPQFKTKLYWVTIGSWGDVDFIPTGFSGYDTRESALRNIDLHYEGNDRKQIIEFEYINKP